MNERGFFNIVGLCLLLSVAISIAGVHEVEGNFSYNSASVQMEHDLKNAVDSGLAETLEMIKSAEIIPLYGNEAVSRIIFEDGMTLIRDQYSDSKMIFDSKVNVGRLKNISVNVWATIGPINKFIATAYNNNNNKVDCTEYANELRDGIILLSVAAYDNKYQSSMAYVLYDKDSNKYEDIAHYVHSTNVTARITKKVQ